MCNFVAQIRPAPLIQERFPCEKQVLIVNLHTVSMVLPLPYAAFLNRESVGTPGLAHVLQVGMAGNHLVSLVNPKK